MEPRTAPPARGPLDALAGFTRAHYGRGQLISMPGDAQDRVFIVRSGRVRVYLANDARELTLAFLEPGDIFSTHTPAYVAAVAAASLDCIDTARFAATVAGRPELVPSLMRVLGGLLHASVELIETLVFRDAASRLAHFVARTVRLNGKLDGSTWTVPFAWTLADLAQLLGTTRQTVSEVVNQWERAQLIERRGRRHWIVRDLAALEALSKTVPQASASRRTAQGRRR